MSSGPNLWTISTIRHSPPVHLSKSASSRNYTKNIYDLRGRDVPVEPTVPGVKSCEQRKSSVSTVESDPISSSRPISYSLNVHPFLRTYQIIFALILRISGFEFASICRVDEGLLFTGLFCGFSPGFVAGFVARLSLGCR
jgi:hypothetical protein